MTPSQPPASPRERVEAAADLIADELGIDPDDIVISASAGKTPFVCLTATQIEALLGHRGTP